jgi:hypothetical protein
VLLLLLLLLAVRLLSKLSHADEAVTPQSCRHGCAATASLSKLRAAAGSMVMQ